MARWPRLRKGDIVWLNRNGMATAILGRARSRLGVVVAVRPYRTVLGVKVRRDGLKGASWYAGVFWRKASHREVLRYARGRPGLPPPGLRL